MTCIYVQSDRLRENRRVAGACRYHAPGPHATEVDCDMHPQYPPEIRFAKFRTFTPYGVPA